jgi:antitoxin component YwqK of YwqJK toxin-antitoxin module
LLSNSIIISMKKLTLLLLLFSIGKTYAQRANDYSNSRRDNYGNNRVNNYNKSANDDDYSQIRIVDTSQEIRADILPFKTDPKIKNDRYYYWYLNNMIHSTQGGYNGQLLNGHYIAFYPDKNLKEEGNFKRGLKDGVWKTWNRKGDISSLTTWNEGIVVPDNQQPIWKKIPFLNKKDEQPQNPKAANGN